MFFDLLTRSWLFDADNGGGSGGAAQGATGQPADTTQNDAPPATDSTGNMVDFDAQDADGKRLYFGREYVEGLRQEAADERTKAAKLRTDLEQAQKSQPPTDPPQPPAVDTSAFEKRIDELESKYSSQLVNNAIIQAAAQATDDRRRFIDPSDAVRLLDRDSITVGDDGTVNSESVNKALDTLAKAKAHLLEPEQSGRRAATVPPSNPAGTGDRQSAAEQRVMARMQGKPDPFAAQGGGVLLPPESE
jgi:hypothetical protein